MWKYKRGIIAYENGGGGGEVVIFFPVIQL